MQLYIVQFTLCSLKLPGCISRRHFRYSLLSMCVSAFMHTHAHVRMHVCAHTHTHVVYMDLVTSILSKHNKGTLSYIIWHIWQWINFTKLKTVQHWITINYPVHFPGKIKKICIQEINNLRDHMKSVCNLLPRKLANIFCRRTLTRQELECYMKYKRILS